MRSRRLPAAVYVGLVLLVSIASVNLAIANDDPPSIRPPYIEVGDCWSYRASRLFHHGWITAYRECITHIDKGKNVVLALATVAGEGREIETSYSLEWAESSPIDGRYYDPPARFLQFPLRVGDKYKVDVSSVNVHSSARVDIDSYEMAVIGWEDVSVPAGKFRALRIEGLGSSSGTFSHSDNQKRTIWYVPEVNRAVKWSFVQVSLWSSTANRTDGFQVELTKYELNK